MDGFSGFRIYDDEAKVRLIEHIEIAAIWAKGDVARIAIPPRVSIGEAVEAPAWQHLLGAKIIAQDVAGIPSGRVEPGALWTEGQAHKGILNDDGTMCEKACLRPFKEFEGEGACAAARGRQNISIGTEAKPVGMWRDEGCLPYGGDEAAVRQDRGSVGVT